MSETSGFLSDIILVICLFVGTLAVLVGLVFLILAFIKNLQKEKYALNFVTLLIRLPKDNEVKIEAAEQMWTALHALKQETLHSLFKSEDIISFEIIAQKEDIAFYIACPKHLRDLIEKQIHAAYPEADIDAVPEVNIFDDKGRVATAHLQLQHGDNYPIQTYTDLPVDGLNGITSALSKMGDGEAAMIQFILQPEGTRWQEKSLRQVHSARDLPSDPEEKKKTTPSDPKLLDSQQTKTEKLGWRVNLRLVVNAPTMDIAQSYLTNIISSFVQFTSQYNAFVKKVPLLKRSFMRNFIYRYAPVNKKFGRSFILNTKELATILHFPNKEVEVHHIRFLYAKNAPAPREIPTSGLRVGKSIYRGEVRDIYMNLADRRRHMYIIGKTGTGKSEFLKDMIMQDIAQGRGVCAIDPHGEFVEDILQMLPPERAEDVIYFNPSDLDRPMGMNMMEADTEEQKHFVVSSVIGLMYKLYDPHRTGIIGPRFEHAIRNAMLTIMARPGTTFIELVRALTDSKYVEEILPSVTDPIVRRYWTDQMAQTSDFHKSEVLDYIVSKFGRFITNKTMRNIIGQSASSFNFRQAMDEKKVILCNLSKGILGEEDAKFLGLILVPKVLTAAMSRQDIPMEQREDFFLYVDEFQNYATEDFAVILSEARKYRLNLIVANQYIGQIEEDVKNAVFGNVGTMISFRVGVTDATYLAHEFAPVFTETDLTNVEKYHVYIKTIVNNEPVPAFSMSLEKDMKQVEALMNPELAAMIKQLSRFKYGRDRAELEQEIGKRSNL
ncbi:type IV secretion system DNA-binding domain-containing protein [Microgenomates group bacterium]|nr:type IV secretion system DNA-binding domain-containing protein [Microgenomates group bacterium]